MDIYFGFLLLNNVFAAFVSYKIYTAFYERCRVSKSVEIAAFCVIQVIILSIYLAHPPSYLMTLSNVVLYLGYTFLYSNNLKKNLLVVSGVFAINLAFEGIVYVLFIYNGIGVDTTISHQSMEFIVSNTSLNMLRFIFMLAIRRFVKTNKEYVIPTTQWLCLFTPPVLSVILIVILPTIDNLPESLLLGLATFCICIIIPVFILFDSISKVMIAKMKERAFIENQKYYESQLLLMKSQLSDMKILKHDLKNKLTPLYLYAEVGNIEGIKNKLSEIMGICEEPTKYSNAGSTDIDSIINFKLSFAKKFTDHIDTEILMPEDLNLPDFDLVVILGNLLDNAIEGIQTSVSDRFIDVKMAYSKGRIIIMIENSFDGIVDKKGGSYLTRKENSGDHGLGLKSVQSILDKYNGVLKLKSTKDKFTAKVLLYVK